MTKQICISMFTISCAQCRADTGVRVMCQTWLAAMQMRWIYPACVGERQPWADVPDTSLITGVDRRVDPQYQCVDPQDQCVILHAIDSSKIAYRGTMTFDMHVFDDADHDQCLIYESVHDHHCASGKPCLGLEAPMPTQRGMSDTCQAICLLHSRHHRQAVSRHILTRWQCLIVTD